MASWFELIIGGRDAYARGSMVLLSVILIAVMSAIIRRLHAAYFGPLARLPHAHWISRFCRLWFSEHDVYDLQALHEKHGPLVRYGSDQVSVADWEAYKTIYMGQNSSFLKDPIFYRGFYLDPANWSVFTQTDPVKHRLRRANMSSMFSRSSLLSLEPLLKAKVDKVISKMLARTARGSENNVFAAFRCLTMDIISPLAFGECLNFLDAHEDFSHPFFQALDGMGHNHTSQKMQTYPHIFYWLGKLSDVFPSITPNGAIQMGKLAKYANACYTAFHTNRQSVVAKSPYPIIFELLTANTKNDPTELTPSLASTEAVDLLVAGSDTTAHTIACTCWALTIGFPETGKKLYQELLRAFPFQDDLTTASIQDLEKLPYLTSCVKEGLRFAEAGNGLLPRIVPKGGTVLCGHFMPAGTTVASSSVFISRMESIFPQPRKFSPERWQDEDGGYLNTLEAYQTVFGKGGRQCIGMQLATYEIYIALATVFRKCLLKPTAGTPKELQIGEAFVGYVKGHDLPFYLEARAD